MIPAGEALPELLKVSVHPNVVIEDGYRDSAGGVAGAAFSPCTRYRYLLWRMWNPDLPFWSFGMLNPSTADHLQLDPTIRRCISTAQEGGAGGLVVWNLFALRATKPEDMKRAPLPIGSANDRAIRHAVAACEVNIAAWGGEGVHLNREDQVRAMLSAKAVELHALAFTKHGLPRHPLYLLGGLKPQPWEYWA